MAGVKIGGELTGALIDPIFNGVLYYTTDSFRAAIVLSFTYDPITPPPFGRPTDPDFVLTSPFTMTGTLTIPGVVRLDLTGEGTLSVTYRASGQIFSESFVFAPPVPEPAPLALLALGVGAIFVLRSRPATGAGVPPRLA